jgi:hypoxanthine phosphoribosyltransferase
MSDAGHGLADALAHSDVLFDRAAVEAAIDAMAVPIARDFAGSVPLFLTVMHGGLPFAARLAMALGEHGQDLALDYLHATRYRGDTRGGELDWRHRPVTPLAGRRVLLVDDIVDEGHTLSQVRDWCRAEGAAEVRIAAMTVKQHDRCVPGLVADYAGLHVPDRYVFGYGMDYHEQGRNLPAIHALRT